ncbi:class I SAM-dependent methyltransferase [Moorena producens]|uniref:class I SAM-dependent methyltransferase n=1 Tax=Moorena producens TaxID=1155739 RepID=UPI003C75933C
MSYSHSFQEDIAFLEQHYSSLLKEHGDTPQASQWRDEKTQELRLDILTQIENLSSMKVLDFGCGTGHLLTFLKAKLEFTGEYVGYDLSGEIIATAQNKFPGIRFQQRDILADGIPENFDFILISGVFNNRTSNNWVLMKSLLKCLFKHTRKGIAFNALSTYVDYFEPELFYIEPEKVFKFCKEELSPRVTLRHDYLVKQNIVPFEFTIYVYKNQFLPEKLSINAAN